MNNELYINDVNDNNTNNSDEENAIIIIESIYNSKTKFDIIDITIFNNIFNNNINNSININPFSLEDLDHITVNDFRALFTNNFNNHFKIINKIGHLIYKNKNNINFCKHNNIIIYLSEDIEIKHISEDKFYKIFKDNLKKLCIELFHIHKNNISLDDLIEYMQYFLLCFGED